MVSVQSVKSTPALTITTSGETLASNIPGLVIVPPGSSPQQIIIRGMLVITTGTATTALQVKLRVGPNNTSTNQVGNTLQVSAGASGVWSAPFEFIDTNLANINNNGGYSLTVTQVSATGNGTVTEVDYELDYSSH